MTSFTSFDGTETGASDLPTATNTDGGQSESTGSSGPPTTPNTDLASSTTFPGVPAITNDNSDPLAVIIQIFFGSVTFNIGRPGRVDQCEVAKRQTVGMTSGVAGSDTGCTFADRFLVLANQLVTAAGVVSTSEDAPFVPFVSSTPVAATTTAFDIDSNDFLRWANPAFVGGEAIFCQISDISINALFEGPFNAAHLAGCVVVSLRTIPASLCRNNQIIDPVAGLPVDGGAAPSTGLPANFFTAPQVNRACVLSVLSYLLG